MGLKLKFDLIGKVLNIGLPVFGEQLIMRLGHLFYERMGASLGTAAYAADQVALKAEAFSYMPGFGLAVATATVVGKTWAQASLRRQALLRIVAFAQLPMATHFIYSWGLRGAGETKSVFTAPQLQPGQADFFSVTYVSGF